MGWFSFGKVADPEDKASGKMLDWALDKIREKKRRDAERKAQEQKDAEKAVRKALHEDEDKEDK